LLAAPAFARTLPASPGGSLKQVYGKVVSFDPRLWLLALKGDDGVTRTFVLGADARLTKGGYDKSIDAGDLKPGARVALRYGRSIAASVHVKVSPAHAAVARTAAEGH